LLSKASEYSNFIAKDLDELQANMEEQAMKALKKIEKKKRKEDDNTDGRGRKSKRQKKGSENLVTAQAKDTEIRLGSKPIFIQPPNLATDCVLKDYQLEGVRWLASLYENGVSGILADEMVRNHYANFTLAFGIHKR
jgi:ATP-dependent DNA helicase